MEEITIKANNELNKNFSETCLKKMRTIKAIIVNDVKARTELLYALPGRIVANKMHPRIRRIVDPITIRR